MSESIENFLEKIYLFSKDKNRPIKTTELAKLLNIKPSAVTNMAKKLHKLNYVIYEPYVGITLTTKGIKRAKTILDKHSTIKVFLTECLGLNNERANEEACKLEHALSDDTLQRLKHFMVGYEKDKKYKDK
ncbi:MAG TPA: metal-dependent transcriptional regulator [Methanothermococcus okinawensis]|uniref:Metal-dependent transcriptional regulator n=1 Tax=Methanothermococcus okinawensis TaxID=155863 RepID=A0A832YRK9_9EURY|nr:metal-dependent transcriptional regulator [Methanothermococcus okinawensis]